MAVDTGVSAGIGALFGKVTDVIGEKVLNKLGKLAFIGIIPYICLQ